MDALIALSTRFELRTPWSRMGDTSIATAYDTLIGREVTLKRHENADADVQRTRTLDEARAMVTARHSGMLPLHDVVELAGEGLCLVLGSAQERLSGPPSIPSPLASMLAPPLPSNHLRRRQNILAGVAIALLVVLYLWQQRANMPPSAAAPPSRGRPAAKP